MTPTTTELVLKLSLEARSVSTAAIRPSTKEAAVGIRPVTDARFSSTT